ncbi:MAG: hypothetical protein R3D51_15350 [Hyphomicrobiaceae bacterium]
MTFLDQIPWWVLIAAALTLGLAPFVPEPHIVEKLRMLAQGTLRRPIDVFDLVLHATPFVLLAAKVMRTVMAR